MLVSAFAKSIINPKKLATGTQNRTVTNHAKLIGGIPICFPSDIKEAPVEIQNKLSSHKIFSITFNYLGKVYCTKVLKMTYAGNQSLYKVALSSNIASHSSMCWLQYQTQGWDMLLGQELDEQLILAITLAIGYEEF